MLFAIQNSTKTALNSTVYSFLSINYGLTYCKSGSILNIFCQYTLCIPIVYNLYTLGIQHVYQFEMYGIQSVYQIENMVYFDGFFAK